MPKHQVATEVDDDRYWRKLTAFAADVREYEQGHGLSADRPSRTRAGRGTRDSAPPAPDEDGATAAVMDFLGDDSD